MSATRRKAKAQMPVVLTVGHSTRTWKDFLRLLRAHGIRRVVDVRSIPPSRHNPQFNRETLSVKLRAARIGYVHLKKLGGLRHARRDSTNTGWRNASFRGFADYMQTFEFEAGLERLMKLAAQKRCAIMCAEAVPWRCHRSLIADALTVRGVRVEDILSEKRAQFHSLTAFARVRGNRIMYPQFAKTSHGAGWYSRAVGSTTQTYVPAQKTRHDGNGSQVVNKARRLLERAVSATR